MNIHGQCLRCNYFISANLTPYRVELLKRIGEDELKKLDDCVALNKRLGFKWDRFSLIDTIERYKKKVKELR